MSSDELYQCKLKGEHAMHPMNNYETLRRGREELLRQAERERMARAATVKQLRQRKFHREFANWLGIHLVSWGHKLEGLGTSGKGKLPASVRREPSTM